MTTYKSDKHGGLTTYATDGSLIRFTDGRFVATNKAQRDALDKLKGVRKVESAKPAEKPKETDKPKEAPKAKPKAKAKPKKSDK